MHYLPGLCEEWEEDCGGEIELVILDIRASESWAWVNRSPLNRDRPPSIPDRPDRRESPSCPAPDSPDRRDNPSWPRRDKLSELYLASCSWSGNL